MILFSVLDCKNKLKLWNYIDAYKSQFWVKPFHILCRNSVNFIMSHFFKQLQKSFQISFSFLLIWAFSINDPVEKILRFCQMRFKESENCVILGVTWWRTENSYHVSHEDSERMDSWFIERKEKSNFFFKNMGKSKRIICIELENDSWESLIKDSSLLKLFVWIHGSFVKLFVCF